MDDQQSGELIGKVNSIKENTDRIPDMAALLAVHESKINQIMPKVEAHEAMAQRALTVAGIAGLVSGFFSYIVGQRGVH
jgi:hypothetical protein